MPVPVKTIVEALIAVPDTRVLVVSNDPSVLDMQGSNVVSVTPPETVAYLSHAFEWIVLDKCGDKELRRALKPCASEGIVEWLGS